MSRYTFCGKSPRYRIITGYDPGLSSLFAQVEDLAFETQGTIINEQASIGDSPEEGLLIWVGADAPITDVHDIEKAIADYGTIPQNILVRLHHDQECHPTHPTVTPAHIPLPPALTQAFGQEHKGHHHGQLPEKLR